MRTAILVGIAAAGGLLKRYAPELYPEHTSAVVVNRSDDPNPVVRVNTVLEAHPRAVRIRQTAEIPCPHGYSRNV